MLFSVFSCRSVVDDVPAMLDSGSPLPTATAANIMPIKNKRGRRRFMVLTQIKVDRSLEDFGEVSSTATMAHPMAMDRQYLCWLEYGRFPFSFHHQKFESWLAVSV